MVYRTPCPPPEEPKMPFKLRGRHFFVAAYMMFWIVNIMIYIGNSSQPNIVPIMVGVIAGLHVVGFLIAGVACLDNSKWGL